MQNQLAAATQKWKPHLIEWRRHLHTNPELSFEEYETTAWLARKMEEWAIPYTRPTPTGLVGLIEGNRPGKTIAIRADIDALPIQEENTFSFRSTKDGIMHACGHDGHTAILLGVTQFFSQNRDFSGRIKLLFQPAEERAPGGALAFVEAGVLDQVDACIGLHLYSATPTTTAAVSAGPITANSDGFRAVIRGRGGHGAAPHKTVDAVMVACHAVLNLQTIVSRKIDPIRPSVISVGAIHAGKAGNVIADTAEIRGTVRSYHDDVRLQLQEEIQRTLAATCTMHGADVELDYTLGYPACVNHPDVSAVMHEVACTVLGTQNVTVAEPLMGGEDFAYYGTKVPSSFLFLGCRNPAEGAEWEHHHPRFTVDEAALPLGMNILGQAALRLLDQ